MGGLQNNPSIGWVIPKSTHVCPPLAWGNNKENIKQEKKNGLHRVQKYCHHYMMLAKWANSHKP
jgi:hypothetical protein